jgi:uncharacterized protein
MSLRYGMLISISMKQLPSRLRRLDDALADLPLEEPMLLTELDGFLTGVIVSPELIMPSEWLPVVWGADEVGGAPFDDPADVQWFTDAVMARYNEIARDLGRGKLQPIFDFDERNGDVLWELWADGFQAAMMLRPDGWPAVTSSGEAEVAEALAGMRTLIGVATGETELMSHEVNELSDDAPGLIPTWALRLYAWRLGQLGAPTAAAARPAKVGRNEPCTCGSGKKYKRCCGLN